jgi:hypothetical protein
LLVTLDGLILRRFIITGDTQRGREQFALVWRDALVHTVFMTQIRGRKWLPGQLNCLYELKDPEGDFPPMGWESATPHVT